MASRDIDWRRAYACLFLLTSIACLSFVPALNKMPIIEALVFVQAILFGLTSYGMFKEKHIVATLSLWCATIVGGVGMLTQGFFFIIDILLFVLSTAMAIWFSRRIIHHNISVSGISAGDKQSAVRPAMTTLTVMNAVLSFCLLMPLILVVPVFGDMFKEAGHALPVPTQMLVDFSGIICKFSLFLSVNPLLNPFFGAIIGGCRIVEQHYGQTASRRWLKSTITISILLIVAMIVVMFLPIFGLAEVVLKA
jgi:hypothetical protein